MLVGCECLSIVGYRLQVFSSVGGDMDMDYDSLMICWCERTCFVLFVCLMTQSVIGSLVELDKSSRQDCQR